MRAAKPASEFLSERSESKEEHRTSLMIHRTLKQFAAVLIGNVLYFFVLMPHLPMSARHQPYRLDWGLLVDAWICLVIYGLIELVIRLRRKRGRGN